ncbi:sugar ABC transporter ATP-binding protein [Okibacterium endophyticum]
MDERMRAGGLEVDDVVKSYSGQIVLKGVSVAVRPGEVVGLVGHNGAGKSTLMRVISGAVKPDSGEVRVDGRPAPLGSPADAIAAGIATVYQELSLLPNLTVTQNVFLGAELRRAGFLSREAMKEQANDLVRSFGLDVDVDRKVGAYPVATRQLLEVAIATHRKARYLLLDEPTTSLEGSQINRFLDLVSTMADQGLGIVLVNHKLEELYAVASRIIALVDGEVRIDAAVSSVSRADVVHAIAGEDAVASSPVAIDRSEHEAERAASEVTLRVSGLRSSALNGVELEARAGRVLGIYGLVGAGRTELLRTLVGLEAVHEGSIELFGRPYRPRDAGAAMRAGVVYVTEERKIDGIVPLLDSSLNTMLPVLRRNYRAGLLDRRALRSNATELMDRLKVKGDRTAPIVSLSGGNQQKVLLARALAQHPKVLLLDEPTKGVDLGVKAEIHRIIRRLAADDGLTVIIVSSEEEEICDVADDVMVMSGGSATGELLDPATLSAASLRHLAWDAA